MRLVPLNSSFTDEEAETEHFSNLLKAAFICFEFNSDLHLVYCPHPTPIFQVGKLRPREEQEFVHH